VQLLESVLQLSASDADGRLTVRDLHRAVSGEGVASAVFEAIRSADANSKTIAADRLLYYVNNITSPV
jgi:hypothetical protein